MKYTLKVNGSSHTVDAAPGTPLLWVIRDQLNLTGTKFGCGSSLCCACTVHVQGNVARAVVEAWREKDVVQCGYCQSGQIMSAVGLLSGNSKPSDSDINAGMAGNACRCATYVRIRDAVHLAAEKLEV